MGTLAPAFVQQFEDINGQPLAGAKLYSWLAGTTTPTALFQDADLTAPHPWPAVADGAGRLTAFMAPTSYKLELRDANDVVVVPAVDGIESVPSGQTNVDITGISGENLAERQVVYLSDGSEGPPEVAGEWYLGDADETAKSTAATLVGVVVAPVISQGNTGQIRLQGTVEGFAGLTPGLSYYISATAGGITSSPPPNARVVGIAQSSTTLLLTPASSSSSDLGVFTQLQVTGVGLDSVILSGGLQTAGGAVQLVGINGKIPAIDSTRFANLSGANLTGIPETAIADGAIFARLAANETITGAWNLSNASTQSGGLSFTGIGGAGPAKIGLNAGQLALLGGASGIGFFNAGGGLLASMDASGVWTFSGGSARGVVVNRVGGDAGIQLTSIGGSGTGFGITSTVGGALSIQHDADANPAVVLDGASNTISLAATGGIAILHQLTPNRINSGSAQPGFLAHIAVSQGISAGVTATAAFVEVYDETGAFSANTFAAPVAGRYLFTIILGGVSTSANEEILARLVTSNRTYPFQTGALPNDWSVSWSTIADMDLGDTAFVNVTVSGSAGISLSSSSTQCYFAGRLMA